MRSEDRAKPYIWTFIPIFIFFPIWWYPHSLLCIFKNNMILSKPIILFFHPSWSLVVFCFGFPYRCVILLIIVFSVVAWIFYHAPCLVCILLPDLNSWIWRLPSLLIDRFIYCASITLIHPMDWLIKWNTTHEYTSSCMFMT